MDNYQSEWRIWAKIVAVLDLISSILMLLSTLLITSIAATATTAVATSDGQAPPEAAVVLWVVWLGTAILAVITSIAMWAAVQLLKATELGRAAKDAYRFCQYWRLVCIVFMVVSLISNLMTARYEILVIQLLVRIIFLYVVHRFMQETEASILMPRTMKQTENV